MTQTLLDAQVEFEREFKSVRHDPKAPKVLTLYSGGVVDAKATPPCLCSTQEMAIELWLRAAWKAAGVDLHSSDGRGNLYPRHGGTLTWRTPPTILKFQMTMTGKHNQDRVVTDRYAVFSEVAFSL